MRVCSGVVFDGDKCSICQDTLYKTGFNLVQTCTACSATSFGTPGGTGPFDCTCLIWFEANATECVQCQTGKYRNESVNLGIANAHFLSSREINLARACSAGNCPTSSSAWWDVETRYHSSRVVDGDLSYGNTYHSSQMNQPFVMVDMETIVYVRRVRVYNRDNCCQDRLENFENRIGNSPMMMMIIC